MDYNNYDRGYAEPSMSASDYMTRTYRWMAGGLLVTFAMAYITATTSLIYLVNSLYFLLTIGELALVFMLSARVQKMSIDGARAAFFGYAILNGMVLSYYFLMFSVGTLVMAFLATAVYFGLMAVYGTTTHKDLTGWGPRLMMALVAMIVTSLVGALFGFGFGASVLYCGIGLVVFMLLTAYDTQKLRQIYAYYAGDAELAEKASIYGALTLYLDFINIFLLRRPPAGHEQPGKRQIIKSNFSEPPCRAFARRLFLFRMPALNHDNYAICKIEEKVDRMGVLEICVVMQQTMFAAASHRAYFY